MEQTNQSIKMLDLITRPAFFVQNNQIIRANAAAQQYGVQAGSALSSLLSTGAQEYSDYTSGSLYLTLDLSGTLVGACVIRMADFDVFLLDSPNEQAELHAMMLAARELREPLNTIMSAAQKIKNKNSEYALQMNRGLFQMLRLIGNMSDAEQYCNNALLHLETRDVSGIFDEIFEQATALVRDAKRTIRFTGLHQSAYGLVDKDKLERAVYNLISNAVKFTPEGGEIKASLSRKGNRLYFTIADSGAGIDERLRSDVFTRFLREPGIEDGRFGIGLGMVLVRSIASAHNGTVLIEQPKDSGARVTMTITLNQNQSGIVRSPALTLDYAGEWNHCLVELSDVLSPSSFADIF